MSVDYQNRHSTGETVICRNCCEEIEMGEPYYDVVDSEGPNPEDDLGAWCVLCFNDIFFVKNPVGA